MRGHWGAIMGRAPRSVGLRDTAGGPDGTVVHSHMASARGDLALGPSVLYLP